MADPRLEQIRKMIQEEEEKKNGSNRPSSFGDNASYAFWNIPENTVATVRFLPDNDTTNAWFWIERQTIALTFDGTINGDSPTDKLVTIRVPCVDMFGDTCPIIAETKAWWKDESKIETARKYYKKRSYISQGFVVSSPFEEPTVPENPIRRFILGPELVTKLKAGMADVEMEFVPTDYVNGTDFKIRKTKKGGKDSHNNYSTSEWSRRTRPLSETETIALEQYGLFNLADFRGARPDADGIAAIKAMFHASLKGAPYDYNEFGKYYKPYGNGESTTSTPSTDESDDFTSTKSSSETKKVDETVAEKPASTSKNPQDLLAQLRERSQSRKQ